MRRQIVSPGEAEAARAGANVEQADLSLRKLLEDTNTSDVPTPDDYKDKLLKHIPAEAVAAYLTLDGIIRSSANGNGIKVGLWFAFLVGLVGTPAYLWRLQSVTSSLQLSVSTLSFAVWVFAIGGAFSLYTWYQSGIAAVVLVVYTFGIPIILGKQPPLPPGP